MLGVRLLGQLYATAAALGFQPATPQRCLLSILCRSSALHCHPRSGNCKSSIAHPASPTRTTPTRIFFVYAHTVLDADDAQSRMASIYNCRASEAQL